MIESPTITTLRKSLEYLGTSLTSKNALCRFPAFQYLDYPMEANMLINKLNFILAYILFYPSF